MGQLLVALVIDGGELFLELVADLLLLGDGRSLRRGDALELLGVVGAQCGQICAEPPAIDGPADGYADQQGEQRRTQCGGDHASTPPDAMKCAARSSNWCSCWP
ncbi:hypothetical protein [Geopseudomonas aromaticivorans]|uniref:hypothetical protein n=1 Tax=Geopseudomonas aromaticivorans TaxID=2849492 RepID=UPI0020C8DB65|nr:hypothetical protein [Pseudomonas aromaticivorans]